MVRALLTGSAGMLGGEVAAAWRAQRPDDELVAVTRQDIDLRDRAAVVRFIENQAPDVIIHAAARVGGIQDKLNHPTRYLLDNLLIDTSVISGALDARIPSLLYVGSAAVYPEQYRQPFTEDDILAGPLEHANEGYALAKIAALKLCAYASREFGVSYRVALPSNLYGPGDDFSAAKGHLIAAAIGKLHRARLGDLPTVSVWGDGTARREFTYAADVASWFVQQADRLAHWPRVVNVGAGSDHTVAQYYDIARRVVGFEGGLVFDSTKPEGVRQRILDSTVASRLGWAAHTDLEAGMAAAYAQLRSRSDSRKRT